MGTHRFTPQTSEEESARRGWGLTQKGFVTLGGRRRRGKPGWRSRVSGTQRPWLWETAGAKSSAPSRMTRHADVRGAPGGRDKDVKPAGGRCAFLLRQLPVCLHFPSWQSQQRAAGRSRHVAGELQQKADLRGERLKRRQRLTHYYSPAATV